MTTPLRPARHKSRRIGQRPPFECIALLLQGGGALGSYQAGVYQALAEANLHPDWVAGISIGAINSALIAGNPPEKRVERLREFWEAITTPPFGVPTFQSMEIKNETVHRLVNQVRAFGTLLGGAPGFFTPHLSPPFLNPPGSAEALSYYDVAPLKVTLERLVDFDRINAGKMRFSVGAVNVRTGNFVYFDSTTHHIGPAHVMASGSLPPGFPATEIDGQHYWDGGIVSNTPLEWVLNSRPRQDTLAFQVDLWNARGELPRDLNEADLRQKEIRFSSRTRSGTNQFKKTQRLRRAFVQLLKQLPAGLRNEPHTQLLAQEADEHVFNIIHMIYRAKRYEGTSKDYEFSRRTMEEHWQAGHNDAVRTLRHPEFNKTLSPFDVTHAFKVSWLYELPFGRGTTFFSNAGKLLDALVGGWNINGSVKLQSGTPINFGNVSLVGMDRKELEDLIGVYYAQPITYGSTVVPSAPASYLPAEIIQNTFNAFANLPFSGKAIVPAGYGGCIQQFTGQCGISNLVVHGPNFFRTDLSLSKKIKLGESRNIELRASAFNALNNPQWRVGGWSADVVNVTAFGSGWGQLTNGTAYLDTSTTNDQGGRTIELMIRINF